ncbi:MAG: hypothetical protein MSA77_09440 [Selenomonadales bacterium]|nr:hypothetical protein [Selenomonadales bacterium]
MGFFSKLFGCSSDSSSNTSKPSGMEAEFAAMSDDEIKEAYKNLNKNDVARKAKMVNELKKRKLVEIVDGKIVLKAD